MSNQQRISLNTKNTVKADILANIKIKPKFAPGTNENDMLQSGERVFDAIEY